MFITVKRKYKRTVVSPTPTPTATPTPTPTATPTPTPSPTPISYNTGSLLFNSSSFQDQYLSVSGLTDVATSADFTIEYYVRFNKFESGTQQTIFSSYSDALNNTRLDLYIDNVTSPNEASLYLNMAGSIANTSTSTRLSFSTSSWNHIAMVRKNSTSSFYFDGVKQSMQGSSNNNSRLQFGTGTSYIGVKDDGTGTPDNNYLKANLTNFRFVNGTALYTASFTPSYWPLTNVTNTKLLLLTETNAAKYTDTSGNCTVSSNGTPDVAYSIQSPFPFTPIIPTPTPTPTPTRTPTPTPTPSPTSPPAPPATVYTICMNRSNPLNRPAASITTSPANGTCRYSYARLFSVSANPTYFDHWSLSGATFYTGYNSTSNPCYVYVTLTSATVTAHFN